MEVSINSRNLKETASNENGLFGSPREEFVAV